MSDTSSTTEKATGAREAKTDDGDDNVRAVKLMTEAMWKIDEALEVVDEVKKLKLGAAGRFPAVVYTDLEKVQLYAEFTRSMVGPNPPKRQKKSD